MVKIKVMKMTMVKMTMVKMTMVKIDVGRSVNFNDDFKGGGSNGKD